MELSYRFESVVSQFYLITILQTVCFTIIYSQHCSTSFFLFKNDKHFQCDNAHSVEALFFRDSNLQSLSDASFSDFRNVQKLVILNCILPNTIRNLLAGLKTLKTVTISSSNMPSDIGIMFGENTQVLSLSLTNNSLITVKGNLSLHFPSVESIDLKENKIEEIGFENSNLNNNSGRGVFSYLQKVTIINLRKNAIKYLRNYTFTNLASIKELDLSFNAIRKIDAAAISISTGSDNVIINIANNALKEVRSFMFYLCSGVTKLYLMHNKISRVENRAFSGLVSLKELSLKNNSIPNVLPGMFQSLLSLKVLDISDNLLKTIPANVFNECNNVTKIDLSGNQIGMIHPLAFEGLISLTELFLEANEVSDLVSFKIPLPNLKTVNLQQNRISQVSTGAFEGCIALEVLDLSKNRIYFIENGAFFANAHLKQLNLEHNSIQVLSCASFANLSSLESLNLDGNRLSAFRLSYFSPLQNLKQLAVQLRRDSECECSLFMKIYQQKIHIDIEVTQLSETCKLYYYAYTSSPSHLAEECNAEIVEQCHWQRATTENSQATVLQNVSTCPGCISDGQNHKSNASKSQQQNVERTDSPVALTMSTPQSEVGNLRTATSGFQQSKEEIDFLTPGTPLTQQTTQQEQRDIDISSISTTHTELISLITTSQATEESKVTGNPNQEDTTTNSFSTGGNVPEGSTLGISYSRIALSFGGGVVVGLVFGSVLCAGIHVWRRWWKRREGGGGVPRLWSERHVHEKIDGEVPSVLVEQIPLNPISVFTSFDAASDATGTEGGTSVEVDPVELLPQPPCSPGKGGIGDDNAPSQTRT